MKFRLTVRVGCAKGNFNGSVKINFQLRSMFIKVFYTYGFSCMKGRNRKSMVSLSRFDGVKEIDISFLSASKGNFVNPDISKILFVKKKKK